MTAVSTATAPATYAGEISPTQAWTCLGQDATAKLIDVRTQAEWSFVGIPDLSSLDKQVLLVSWQIFPAMDRNTAFVAQLESQGIRKDDVLLLVCRSGVRSRAAAEYLTALGYGAAWNVADGFEGPHDGQKHRGAQAGWKFSGLPWAQG